MSLKTSSSERKSFLTCSEDMFEGFIQGCLNSSNEVLENEDMETEETYENDVAEVVGAEESSADSAIEIQDGASKHEKRLDGNLLMDTDVSPRNNNSIVIRNERTDLKLNFNKNSNDNPELVKPKSIKIVKNLPIYRSIAPKVGQTKLGSGIFYTNNSNNQEVISKDVKEILLNGNKKLVITSPKALLKNENESNKSKEHQNISIVCSRNNDDLPIKKRKSIILNKPINVLHTVDRKSLDVSGISLLSRVFNGHVSKKVEVNMASNSNSEGKRPELESRLDDIGLEGSREQREEITRKVALANPGQTKQTTPTISIKKASQLVAVNNNIVTKKLDSSKDSIFSQKNLLSLMKRTSDNDKLIVLPNSQTNSLPNSLCYRLKPISEHSVQCVFEKNVPNGLKEKNVHAETSQINKSSPLKRVRLNFPKEKTLILNRQSSDEQHTSVGRKRSESATNTSVEVSSVSAARGGIQKEKDLSELLMDQLKYPAVPYFAPRSNSNTQLFDCSECNDKFILQSSLEYHRSRRSVLIGYSCCVCNSRLTFFNRCTFLSHIRSHNQELLTLDISSISIDPIPRNLFHLESGDDADNVSSTNSRVETCVNIENNAAVSSKAVADNAKLVKTHRSQPNDRNEEVSEDILNEDIEEEEAEVEKEGGGSDGGSEITIIPVDRLPEKNKDNETPSTTKDLGVEPTAMDGNTNSNIEVLEMNNSNPTTPTPNSNNVMKSSDSKVSKLREMKRSKICPECKSVISPKMSLQQHLVNEDRPCNPRLRCNECKLILPSRCSLRMHLRYHIPLKPYRCPDCGIEFEIYERYLHHIKYLCCHLAKVVRYECSLCRFRRESLSSFKTHIMDKHTRNIIKCQKCPVAFLSMAMIVRHQQKEHNSEAIPSTIFMQCQFCPGKLIPRKKFSTHIQGHINTENFKIYMYMCYKCNDVFLKRSEFVEHYGNCISTIDDSSKSSHSKRNSVGGTNFIEVQSVDSNPSSLPMDNDLEDEHEIIGPVNNSSQMEEDEVYEQDPLSLEGFRAEDQTVKEPKLELCVLCKKQQVIIQPGEDPASQSLCCKECVRPCDENDLQPRQMSMTTRRRTRTQTIYKCKLCSYLSVVDFYVLVKHFRRMHKTVKESNIENFVSVEKKNVFHSIRSKTVSAAECIKDKYLKKKRPSDSIAVKEESEDGNDSHEVETCEEKNQKKSPKSKPNSPAQASPSSESGLVMPSRPDVQNLQCSRCDFTAQKMSELRQHMTQHRSDPSAMQCLDCGECFVVLPSLEKHLVIHHRIMDVDKYIANNPSCLSQEVNGDDSFKCSVCQTIFESRLELDKHFRIHGMAFLKRNRPLEGKLNSE